MINCGTQCKRSENGYREGSVRYGCATERGVGFAVDANLNWNFKASMHDRECERRQIPSFFTPLAKIDSMLMALESLKVAYVPTGCSVLLP
eukprot:7657716-Pyramimonas_sp.AAC.2